MHHLHTCSLVMSAINLTGVKCEEEVFGDKLRTVVAQLEFHYEMCEWERKGIPFRTHMYVPEVIPETGSSFYEREDEAHLLKVGVWLYCKVKLMYTA